MAIPGARTGWLGASIVLLAAALFSTGGIISRFAYEAGVQPFAFVTWRAGVGAIGLVFVVSLLGGGRAAWATVRGASRGVLAALVLAIFLAAGINLAMFLAFDRTTIALALLGFYTYPAMVAAATGLLDSEPLDATRVVALGLALAGMVAVILGGLDSTSAVRIDALGIGLSLLAAGFHAMFLLTSRRYVAVRADVAIAVILAGSTIVAAVVSIVADGAASLVQPLDEPIILAMMVGSGLVAAALPSVLFLTAIRWIGAVRAGILALFEPVVGVALAAWLLAEGVQPLQVLGGATILAAALLVQRGARSATRGSPAIAPAPGGP